MALLRSEPYERRRLRMLARAQVGSSVLDIGYAQDPNPYLRGSRVGLDLARPATPSGYDEELVGDVERPGDVLGERVFDTVILGEVIEHLERPLDALRALRPHVGQRLLLTTPNPLGFPVVGLELLRSRRFFYTPEHVYYFAPRWMERLLSRAGYRVVHVRGVGLWLPGGVLPSPLTALSYQVLYIAEPA